VYLGGIFSTLIFLGVCAGENIGMVPFDFLLGFGIFYLSTCVSDVERFPGAAPFNIQPDFTLVYLSATPPLYISLYVPGDHVDQMVPIHTLPI